MEAAPCVSAALSQKGAGLGRAIMQYPPDFEDGGAGGKIQPAGRLFGMHAGNCTGTALRPGAHTASYSREPRGGQTD